MFDHEKRKSAMQIKNESESTTTELPRIYLIRQKNSVSIFNIIRIFVFKNGFYHQTRSSPIFPYIDIHVKKMSGYFRFSKLKEIIFFYQY